MVSPTTRQYPVACADRTDRLDVFMEANGIRPNRLAREAKISRQHLRRLRTGAVSDPGIRTAIRIRDACGRMLSAASPPLGGLRHPMKFTAVYVQGDGDFIVAFVEELTDIVVQGKTIEQARQRVMDAVRILSEMAREECADATGDRPVILRETLRV